MQTVSIPCLVAFYGLRCSPLSTADGIQYLGGDGFSCTVGMGFMDGDQLKIYLLGIWCLSKICRRILKNPHCQKHRRFKRELSRVCSGTCFQLGGLGTRRQFDAASRFASNALDAQAGDPVFKWQAIPESHGREG